jgi:aminopeptidase N
MNAGAQGYYRTGYPTETLRALARDVEEALTPSERLVLLSDEWALVRSERHTAADYLTLVSGFTAEHSNGVLRTIVERLGFVDEYLTTTAARPLFAAFVRSLFGRLYSDIGFASRAGDTDEQKALRSTVVSALGGIGRDADVLAQARTAVDRALRGDLQLEPATARTVVRLAAAGGDAALLEALMAAAERAESPEERYLYLYAVASFRDPVIIARALEYSLTPRLRSQDTALYLSRFLVEEAGRPQAWAFLKEHWSDLEPKIAIAGGDVTLVGSLAAFCDATARDDIRTFLSRHPLPAASRTLSQTIERIDNCIALRKKQTASVTAWLRTR